MVQLINAFRGESPIGAVLTRLGQTMFGDQAGAQLNREQALAAQRQNTETANLMRMTAEGGLETLSPLGQAMLIGSGYDPNDLGRIGAMGAATQFGARDPRTTNWSAGMGEYGDTAEAFDLDLAETARNNDLQSGDRRYGTDVGAQTSITNNELDNTTTRRGQDLTYRSNIYGTDVGAQTSIANNELDNTTARRGQDLTHKADIYGTDVGARTDLLMNAGDNAAAQTRQDTLPLPAIGADGLPVFTTQGNTGGFSPVLDQAEVQGTQLMRMFDKLPPVNQQAAVDALPTETEITGAQLDQNWDNLGGLDPYQQRALGVDPDAGAARTPRNYRTPDGKTIITYDGVTDAMTGQPLPPGGQLISTSLQGGADEIGLTNAVQTDVQSDILAIDRFNNVAGMMMDLVNDPATTWGGPAWVQNKLQEVAQGVGQIAEYIRPEDAATVQQFLPDMYNPNLTAQQTLHTLMLYLGAAALAGQQGRSVSDADIQMFRQAIPDPMGLFTSRTSMRTALETLGTVLQGYRAQSAGVLENGLNTAVPGGQEAPAAPAAAFTLDQLTMPDFQETMQNALSRGMNADQALDAIAAAFGVPREQIIQRVNQMGTQQ